MMRIVFTVGFLLAIVVASDALQRRERRTRFNAVKCDPNRKEPYAKADPNICNRYVLCVEGKVLRKWCLDGKVFDVKSLKCVPREDVDCFPRYDGEDYDPEYPDCVERRNGEYQIDGVCDQYLLCSNSRTFVRDCAFGSVYDTYYGHCVQPDVTSRRQCKAAAEFGVDCAFYGAGGHSPYEHVNKPVGDSCIEFVSCYGNGDSRHGTCSPGTAFDRDSQRCLFFKDVPGCEAHYRYQGNTLEDVLIEIQEEQERRKEVRKRPIETFVAEDEPETDDAEETNETDDLPTFPHFPRTDVKRSVDDESAEAEGVAEG